MDTDRFMSHVEKLSNGCWQWKSTKSRLKGYGYFKVGGKQVLAHRWSYEAFVGRIPDGLQIDHLCRNPSCVNPDHLESVTGAENTRRAKVLRAQKTHCSHGHLYDDANTYYYRGLRRCRQCGRSYSRKRNTCGK